MFVLMFLKSYLNISDRQLLERYNSDWMLQYLFGKVLADDQQIGDMIIMTRIRAYLEKHCEWEKLPEVLINHWKHHVNNTHVLSMDATSYEPCIRFPTDGKLLWECCVWIFEDQLFRLCIVLAIEENVAVQDLPYEKLQERLKADGQVMVLEERL